MYIHCTWSTLVCHIRYSNLFTDQLSFHVVHSILKKSTNVRENGQYVTTYCICYSSTRSARATGIINMKKQFSRWFWISSSHYARDKLTCLHKTYNLTGVELVVATQFTIGVHSETNKCDNLSHFEGRFDQEKL